MRFLSRVQSTRFCFGLNRLAIASLVSLSFFVSEQHALAANCRTIVDSYNRSDVVLGQRNAPVHIAMYGSLACPHCAFFASNSWDIVKRFVRDGSLQFTYRQFPLDPQISDNNAIAAHAAVLALHSRNFLAVAEILYEHRAEWTGDANLYRLRDFADRLGSYGVNYEDVDDDALLDEIMLERQCYSSVLGISATPFFVVNGIPHQGEISRDDLLRLLIAAASNKIDEILRRAQ